MVICSVNQCLLKSRARWYCEGHYRKFMKYWNPEHCKRLRWTNRSKHELYSVYKQIKRRCYNVMFHEYHNYGGRWIKMCNTRLWPYGFSNFIIDMWKRPEWYTIDRIDNNWNYEPWNCKRSTRHQQCANKRNSKEVVWVQKHYKKPWRVANLYYKWKFVLNKYFVNREEAIKARLNAEKCFLWYIH